MTAGYMNHISHGLKLHEPYFARTEQRFQHSVRMGRQPMNHIPDEVLEAIDEFGESLLLGTPKGMTGKLRTDLRIEIVPDSESTATCRYTTVHTQFPPALRDRGSFMTTIIDGIDQRLHQWGIEPAVAYTYVETVDDTHQYEGTLQLP